MKEKIKKTVKKIIRTYIYKFGKHLDRVVRGLMVLQGELESDDQLTASSPDRNYARKSYFIGIQLHFTIIKYVA